MIFNGRTPVFPPAINLAIVLSNRGVDFTFVNMSADNDFEGTLDGYGRLVSIKASPHCLRVKILRYPLAFLIFTWKLFRLSAKIQPDVIMGCWGGGYLISRILRWMGNKSRIVFWANEYIRHDELRVKDPLRYVVWAEKKLAAKADLTVVADPIRGKYQSAYLGVSDFLVVRNVPTQESVPDGASQLADLIENIKKDQPSCKIFVFAGSICNGAKIPQLLASFSLWPNDCVLVLVGTVDQDLPDFFDRLVGYPGRVFHLQRISYHEVLRGLLFADAGIAFYNIDQPWVNEKYCAPCKVGDYLKIGLPILLSCNETLSYFLEQYPVGVAVDPRSPSSIVTGVRELLLKIDNGIIRKKLIKDLFQESLSMEKQCEPFLKKFAEWESIDKAEYSE